jgi:thiol:disulfide interchange protein DsbC
LVSIPLVQINFTATRVAFSKKVFMRRVAGYSALMKCVSVALAATLGLATVTLAQADAVVQPVSKATADKISKGIEGLIGPGYKVQSVFKTTIFGGLYEVRVGDNLLYTDENLSHVFSGNVFDGKNFDNITEERISKLTAIQFSELPLELALKTVNGKGTRKVAVFEDANCGYCKRFRKTLSEVDDTTIYTFVVPMLGPDSLAKTKAVYCAADKSKVWDDWMLRNKPLPTEANCKDVVSEKLIALRQKLSVTGTPTSFFIDGSRVAGAVPKDQFEQKLIAASKSKS